ncbi:MAG: hypothetical protein AB1547_13960 [Thermodesulfobacteriota bacterium]
MPNRSKSKLIDLIEASPHQKTILMTAVALLLVLELVICIAAVNQTGGKSVIVIADREGKVLYEAEGQVLSGYDKQAFEKTFGPVENYQVSVRMDRRPFPFRAWLAAAIGIPIGLILLISYLVRVYMALMYGEDHEEPTENPADAGHGGLVRVLGYFRSMQRFSVFSLGFLVVLAVLVLWMVPDAIGQLAVIGIQAVREFKWFFLGAAVFLALVVLWIIYLRYRLSKTYMENQLQLEKFRMQQQLPGPSASVNIPLLDPIDPKSSSG